MAGECPPSRSSPPGGPSDRPARQADASHRRLPIESGEIRALLDKYGVHLLTTGVDRPWTHGVYA